MADTPLSAQMEDEYKVSKWNRNTVADGTWLQKYTIEKLNDRDIFLANAIDTNSDDIREALNQEIETRTNNDVVISAALTGVSGDFYTFSANVENSASTIVNTIETFSSYVESSAAELNQKINNESNRAQDREDELANKIDTLEAATDVIMVYGTYPDFINTSAELWNVSAGYLTENDVVKILIDDSQGNSANQTYYQAKNVDYDTSSCTWTKIGELDPYYNTAQIDEYFNVLSGTIASNYLSASTDAVSAGKNIIVTKEEGPVVGIKTKDDVSFSSVSAKGFSGTNLSGLNQNDTIDNLFGSAYSGAEASAWIYANSALLDIQPGYGLTYDINELGNKVIGIRQDHCDYQKNVYGDGVSLALGTYSTALGNYSYAFGSYCKTNGSNALAIGDNANATTGAIALGTYNNANGKYSLALGYNTTAFNEASVAIGKGLSGEAPITLGTWNNNVAGATFIIGDGTGTQEGHDVVRKNALVIKDGLVSGRDFSAGNVSLSSLTNLSAFGNGITNTATYNLSAVKLSAGEGIGFKEDTNGVLSITAEGRAYTGENYVKVDNTTKKISLSGELVNSAKSGQSAYNWITTKSATLSAGSGINFNSAAQNTLGISVKYTTTNGYVTELDGIPLSAGANYTQGRCITIDNQNKINLSSDINLDSKLVIDHYNSSDRDTYTSATLECFQLKFNGASDSQQDTYHNSAIYDIFGVQLYDANASKHILMNNENGLCISSYQGNLSSYSRVDAEFIELGHKANVSHASPYYLKFDGKNISAGSNTGNVTAANWASVVSAANGRFVSGTSQEIVIVAPYQTKFVVTATIPGSLNANTYYII